MSDDPAAPAFTSKDADWKKPENQVQIPVWDKPEPYFEFETKDRNLMVARMKPWRVVPDNKQIKTHIISGTRDALDRVYENAIVIGSPAGRGPGIGGLIVMLSFSLVGLRMSVPFLIIAWTNLFMAMLASFACFLCILFAIFALKISIFSPRDQPILFSRNSRMVSFIEIDLPHFLYFWRSRKIEFKTYPWDLVKVRSYKYIEGNRGVMHDSYNLCLLWGNEPSNPKTFKDWVAIGYKGWWEDQRLFQIWEHIRCYMEENGPPINPGERLREGVYTKKWGMAMPEFPPEVIAAAGRLLSDDEVAVLARTPVNKTV